MYLKNKDHNLQSNSFLVIVTKKCRISGRMGMWVEFIFLILNFFSQTKGDWTRGNGLKLHHGRFCLDINKNFSTERVIEHRKTLPRERVELPTLKVFKRCGDAEIRDEA